jgi:hypothetical protein
MTRRPIRERQAGRAERKRSLLIQSNGERNRPSALLQGRCPVVYTNGSFSASSTESVEPAGKTNCCLHCGQRTLRPTCLGPKRNRRLHWGNCNEGPVLLSAGASASIKRRRPPERRQPQRGSNNWVPRCGTGYLRLAAHTREVGFYMGIGSLGLGRPTALFPEFK